jgi:CheY-like chemotaxis protein
MAEPSLTVLVVEDVEMLRAMIERILVLSGHVAIMCPTGEAALERIADPSLRFDVLLTDVGLDGVDGVAVAQAALRHRPGTPVVLMSGDHDAGVLDRLPPGAATRFVGKPYSRSVLLAAVEGAWREARGR